jgi:hypothetical protein
LLKVVEAEQEALVSQEGGEEVQEWPYPTLFDVQCLSDRGDDQRGFTNGSQGYEKGAIGKVRQDLCDNLQSQARFADATGTGEREEPYLGAAQQSTGSCHLLFAPKEGRKWCRQVVCAGAQIVCMRR